MANLNLEKKEIDINMASHKVKNTDVLLEARKNHNELVDAILAINATLAEINTKLSENPDIIKSVEFNSQSITDVEKKLIPALEAKMDSHLKKVEAQLTVKVNNQGDKIIEQEGHSRRRNLIINGKPELDKENTEEVVQEFLVNDLHIEEVEVKNYLFRDVHRLPKSKNKDGTVREGPRPIIVAFLRQKDRNSVMRKAYEPKIQIFL